MKDSFYMNRCLQLAQLGAGNIAPNPLVGCVVVFNNQIIGEGYHKKYGEAHAEVHAIESVADASVLPKSSLYVNLEPCAHYGKTPPCVDLIIKSRIKKVFIACQDPFTKVNGLGIEKLKNAGIEVNVGILKEEAIELNRRFFTFHQKKRPYIILKWAETVDGFVDRNRISTSTSALKITGDTANTLVHKWRAEEAAIMVGKNTALLDNPSLTTRKYNGPNPIRILLDSKLETPVSSKLFDGSCATLVFNELQGKELEIENWKLEIEDGEHEIIYLQVNDTNDISEILNQLYKLEIQSVIIEGGPNLHYSFYQAGIWDEIRRFVSPIEIKKGIKAILPNTDYQKNMRIGTDQLYIYRNL